jgi:hypothetical protein
MTRLVVVCLVAATAALPAAPAAEAQAPYGDAVAAQASVGFGMGGTWGFAIDASSGPSGEAPQGSITANNFVLGSFGFTVSCLTVSGNRAAMIGDALPGPPPPPPPPPFSLPSLIQVVVEDNGTAGDRLAFSLRDFPFPSPGPPPTDCPISTDALQPLRGGDVTVVDRPPLPASKDGCRDGRWRAYGVFRNPGDCVSFVATGGTARP